MAISELLPLKAGSLFALFLKAGRPARHGHAAFHPAITSKPENIRNSAERKPFGAIPIPVIRLFGSALVQEFLQFFKPFVKGDAVCHDQIVLSVKILSISRALGSSASSTMMVSRFR